MAGRILDLLTGDMVEESRKNMERLIQGTDNLISEMRELIKALESHKRTMRELLKAIEENR
jgi:signal transduction histidine kinase